MKIHTERKRRKNKLAKIERKRIESSQERKSRKVENKKKERKKERKKKRRKKKSKFQGHSSGRAVRALAVVREVRGSNPGLAINFIFTALIMNEAFEVCSHGNLDRFQQQLDGNQLYSQESKIKR